MNESSQPFLDAGSMCVGFCKVYLAKLKALKLHKSVMFITFVYRITLNINATV